MSHCLIWYLQKKNRLQTVLSIKVDAVEIFVGSNICGNKKFDENLLTIFCIGSHFSYFNI